MPIAISTPFDDGQIGATRTASGVCHVALFCSQKNNFVLFLTDHFVKAGPDLDSNSNYRKFNSFYDLKGMSKNEGT